MTVVAYKDGQCAGDLVLPVDDPVDEMDHIGKRIDQTRAPLDVLNEDLPMKARLLLQHGGLSWSEGSHCSPKLRGRRNEINLCNRLFEDLCITSTSV